LQLWFMPQLPQILAWIEQGVRVLEIRQPGPDVSPA
jgi:hypothetical protein